MPLTDDDRMKEWATGRVELGPRSLALLRRICRLLEVIAGEDGIDPGKASETADDLSDQ